MSGIKAVIFLVFSDLLTVLCHSQSHDTGCIKTCSGCIQIPGCWYSHTGTEG